MRQAHSEQWEKYLLTSPVTSYFRFIKQSKDFTGFLIASLKERQIQTLTHYAETFHVLLLLQHAVFQRAGLDGLAFWHPL